MRAESRRGEHVSGAEGIFKQSGIAQAVAEYIERGRTHPRGAAASITITVEPIKGRPRTISALKVGTLDTKTPREARAAAAERMLSLGVSAAAIKAAFKALKGGMRGAAIIDAATGMRLEPDRSRGVRASRIGIAEGSSIGRTLRRLGIDTPTVREALVLATKVTSAHGVLAEVCASDDPDYTTGYLASRRLGYVRLLNIKRTRSRSGGRAFIVRPGADIEALIRYL